MADVDIHDPKVDNRAIPAEPLLFAILSAIACPLVFLRLYTRFWIKKALGWDDYTIIPALLFALSWGATQLVQVFLAGMGRHTWTFTPRQQILEYRWNIVSNDLGATSRFFSRLSICLFLLRTVQRTRTWRAYLYVTIALNACVWVATCVLFSLSCAPVGHGQSQPAWCITTTKEDKSAKTILAFNAIVDLMSSLFPFLIVRGSQLNIRTKWTVCLLVGCCTLTAACSIGRLVAVDYHAKDSTWDTVPLTLWSCSEQFGLIIVACLPAIHQLFSHYRDHHTFSRISNSSNATWRQATFKKSSAATISSEKLHHAPTAIIKRTTEVDLELQDMDGQKLDDPTGSDRELGLAATHRAL